MNVTPLQPLMSVRQLHQDPSGKQQEIPPALDTGSAAVELIDSASDEKQDTSHLGQLVDTYA